MMRYLRVCQPRRAVTEIAATRDHHGAGRLPAPAWQNSRQLGFVIAERWPPTSGLAGRAGLQNPKLLAGLAKRSRSRGEVKTAEAERGAEEG